MEDKTLCGYIATMSPCIWRHGKAWIKKLLSGWRCEDPEMGYLPADHFDLWCCLDSREEYLAIRLFYEELLAIK